MELTKLKEYLTTRFEALTDIGVYDGVANGGSYPYLVYSFPSPGSNTIRATRTDRIMEVDYWAETNDDSVILAAAETVKNGKTSPSVVPGLNNSTQDETEGFYKCYIEGDTWEVPEPDNDMVHLKQTYILHIG